MPTTYAHYRFGREVLARLPKETQNLIRRHQTLFDFGVHGPDLLFYYRPLGKNHVNQTGYRCHEQTGREFFTWAIQNGKSCPEPEAYRAYLYGVLCHFALDRQCHPYVGEKEKRGITHSAIEASFDRYLMEQDGLDPVTHNVTRHLKPSEESAGVICYCYPLMGKKSVWKAEKSMVWSLRMLIAKGIKRSVLLTGMRLVGRRSMADMFVPYAQNPNCVDSDQKLMECYESAVTLSDTLFRELEAVLSGRGNFGVGFDHTFGEN